MSKKPTPVQNLKLIIDNEITTFIESNGNPYTYINDKPFSSFPINSQTFIGYLYKQYFNYQKAAKENDVSVSDLTSKHINDYIDYLTGMAYASSTNITTWNRVGYNKDTDTYYYNIGDGVNAVAINEDSMQLTQQSPITFNYFDKFNSVQCFPDLDSDIKNLSLLFKYINIEDQNTKILLLTYIISLFNPLTNKYILYFHGLKGSSKTTSFRIIRSLIDPSPIISHVSKDSNLISLPNSANDLTMLSKYHYCLYFDNVNYISYQIQSSLARMALGQRDSKRSLYSNDDQVVYDYKPAIGINGVNQIMTQDELIQRSLLIEIDRVKERKTEHEIWKEFKKDKTLILGAMLKVFQQSIHIIKTEDIDHSKLPRMADVAKWMTAIAIALGVNKERFYEILAKNTTDQDIESIEFSPTARMVIEFMKSRDFWEGKASELHQGIKDMIEGSYGTVNKKSKYNITIGSKSDQFPSTPISFTLSLKRIIENLCNTGYKIDKIRKKDGQYYQITNTVKKNIQDSYLEEGDLL